MLQETCIPLLMAVGVRFPTRALVLSSIAAVLYLYCGGYVLFLPPLIVDGRYHGDILYVTSSIVR